MMDGYLDENTIDGVNVLALVMKATVGIERQKKRNTVLYKFK